MDTQTLQVESPSSRYAQARYVALASLTGLLAGIVGSYFHLIIDWLVLWPKFVAQYYSGTSLVVVAALITMVCTVFSAFVVRRVAPEASGSGVQEIEGAMEGLRPVRWRRVLPIKFFIGIVSIGSGLVLGREGPTIHIGASIGASITDFFKVSEVERRGILAAGAAAGLACAFNAPLAGVLFIIEETRKEFPYTFRTYMGVIAASLLATVMTQIIGGTAPDLSMPMVKASLGLLPTFILLGVLIAIIGVSLNAGIMRALKLSDQMHKRVPYLYPAIIGLSIGALFILVPYSVTGGESIIMEISHQKIGLAFILGLVVLRFFTLIGSYSSGVPGGIFAPILMLATCVGLAFGLVFDLVFPQVEDASWAFAIAAMGGLFTASVRSPLVGVVLTLELTGAYGMAMPLLATCMTANLVAQWLGGRPIYEQLLDRTLEQAGIKPPL